MDSKMRGLVDAAVKKTQSGTLNWTAFGGESFRSNVGSGRIHVQHIFIEGVNGEPLNRYSVQVTNQTGQVVAEADATEGRPEEDAQLIRDLYIAARTSGLGGYQLLDNMLLALQNS